MKEKELGFSFIPQALGHLGSRQQLSAHGEDIKIFLLFRDSH